MKLKYFAILLVLTSTLSFAQATQKSTSENPTVAQAVTKPAGETPIEEAAKKLAQETAKPTVAPTPPPAPQMPETKAIVKARFSLYKAQQKAAMKLAKAQTAQKLAELNLSKVYHKGQQKVAIETIKAQ